MHYLASQFDAVESSIPYRVTGLVHGISGLTLEAAELPLPVGSLCMIHSIGGRKSLAEVIGFRQDHTLLMPLSPVSGVSRGDRIDNVASAPRIPCSEELLGRVVDGYGNPVDGGKQIAFVETRRIDQKSVGALSRRNIHEPITTSIRAIDGLLTCGLGQRMGIFSGPGVGKSMLMSSIAKNTSADVSVVALIGERGREVQEFLTKSMGPDGMSKVVMVVSTGDDPPSLRVRAAKVATTIAEFFRDKGANVLLLMDSLTRLCQAQRQIGLAAGEPPVTKGLPPSVFSLLPELLERAGKTEIGSITGFYTVLVEGDDFNEPIPDAVKGITDGHIWLNRNLATRGHYPAIDVLQSISRVRGDVVDSEQVKAATRVQTLLAVYEKIEDLVNIGAYVPGANTEYDLAVQTRPQLMQYLQQGREAESLDSARQKLLALVKWIDQREKDIRTVIAKSGRGVAR